MTKNLIQDAARRWNSSFDMLERFLCLKDAVSNVLSEEKWAAKLSVHMFRSDWGLIVKLVEILKVFKEATLLLSKSSTFISMVVIENKLYLKFFKKISFSRISFPFFKRLTLTKMMHKNTMKKDILRGLFSSRRCRQKTKKGYVLGSILNECSSLFKTTFLICREY